MLMVKVTMAMVTTVMQEGGRTVTRPPNRASRDADQLLRIEVGNVSCLY